MTSNGPVRRRTPSGAIALTPSAAICSRSALVAHRRGHARAGHRAELDGRHADAAGGAVDEQPLADDAARPGVKSASCAVVKTSGTPPAAVQSSSSGTGIAARSCTTASSACPPPPTTAITRSPGSKRVDAAPVADDLAGQLEAGDVGRRAGRRGIAAVELEHVGAVEAGGADADEQLAAPAAAGRGAPRRRSRRRGSWRRAWPRFLHGARRTGRSGVRRPDIRPYVWRKSARLARRCQPGTVRAIVAAHPPSPHVPPLWREARVGLEAAALQAQRRVARRGRRRPATDRAVLLIPGFLAGDGTLATMTQLAARGRLAHARAPGIRANVDCSEDACARLEARLEGLRRRRPAQRVAIVGQSRGGVFARALAARRPDLVAGIVTLGSPMVSQLAVHPLVLAQVGCSSAALGTGRRPRAVLAGAACAATAASRSAATSTRDVPARGRLRRVYSRTDGDRRLALLPGPGAPTHVEVDASHCGMSRQPPRLPRASRVALRRVRRLDEAGRRPPSASGAARRSPRATATAAHDAAPHTTLEREEDDRPEAADHARRSRSTMPTAPSDAEGAGGQDEPVRRAARAGGGTAGELPPAFEVAHGRSVADRASMSSARPSSVTLRAVDGALAPIRSRSARRSRTRASASRRDGRPRRGARPRGSRRCSAGWREHGPRARPGAPFDPLPAGRQDASSAIDLGVPVRGRSATSASGEALPAGAGSSALHVGHFDGAARRARGALQDVGRASRGSRGATSRERYAHRPRARSPTASRWETELA